MNASIVGGAPAKVRFAHPIFTLSAPTPRTHQSRCGRRHHKSFRHQCGGGKSSPCPTGTVVVCAGGTMTKSGWRTDPKLRICSPFSAGNTSRCNRRCPPHGFVNAAARTSTLTWSLSRTSSEPGRIRRVASDAPQVPVPVQGASSDQIRRKQDIDRSVSFGPFGCGIYRNCDARSGTDARRSRQCPRVMVRSRRSERLPGSSPASDSVCRRRRRRGR